MNIDIFKPEFENRQIVDAKPVMMTEILQYWQASTKRQSCITDNSSVFLCDFSCIADDSIFETRVIWLVCRNFRKLY
jgi:hypothetical protein